MAKILLICNKSNEVISFRKELILYLIAKSHNVFVVASDNERKEDIEKLGAHFSFIKFNNRSKNVFLFNNTKSKFCAEIRRVRPDVVFTFQAKPNIFGVLACKKVKFENVYSMVEGLGDVFTNTHGLKNKLIIRGICHLYRKAFKYSKKIFFLNQDDINDMVKKYHIISGEEAILIHSIGIDTKTYDYVNKVSSNKNVVLLSRLLINKGILDYCEIAKTVREKRKDITFSLYGEESQIKREDIKKYIDDNCIEYFGYTKDAKKVMSEASIIVSLSKYREGFPRILLEAMALGKPIIATDNVGNKDAVISGVNGYLIPIGDTKQFSEKICTLIDDKETMLKFGLNGRKLCEERFDSDIINKQIYNILFEKNN